MTEGLEEAYRDLQRLLRNGRSLVLATADENGRPEASYAPFVRDEDGNFFVLLSALSPRTAHLAARGEVSILIIEDEAAAKQIFARLRVTYFCAVHTIERGSLEWIEVLGRFEECFGEVVDVLKNLTDFTLFRLIPRSGQFVRGFGQAYRVSEGALERVEAPKP